ncbi:hypothetical protein PGB90_008922 [Kerria lacca]
MSQLVFKFVKDKINQSVLIVVVSLRRLTHNRVEIFQCQFLVAPFSLLFSYVRPFFFFVNGKCSEQSSRKKEGKK